MDESDQFGDNFPMHAYLSYRCKIDRDIAARDKLEIICAENNITLIFDQKGTEEGDSLIEFMDDLSAARCVFLFLSPEYFQSAYTLYELIKIYEQSDLDKCLILPIRVTNDMVEKFRTEAKNYWFSDEAQADRDLLADKLQQQDINALWERIDSAWEEIVKPYLEQKHQSIEKGNVDSVFKDLVSKTKTTVNDVIKSTTKTLQDRIRQNIEEILNSKSNIINIEALEKQLGLANKKDVKSVANELITKTQVSDAIAIITRVVEDQKELLDAKDWNVCFHDAVQISGWLLINSVDPAWWFLEDIKLKESIKNSISGNYTLHDQNYIEVVISRNLLQRAQFTLDDNKQPKPGNKKYDPNFFDVHSSQALSETLLIPIFKDLFGIEPSGKIDVTAKIVNRVKTHYKTQQGKIIYYLVSQDYLKTLELMDGYKDLEKQLTGYLQFICCDKPDKSYQTQASLEDQAQLIDHYANLLLLEN